MKIMRMIALSNSNSISISDGLGFFVCLWLVGEDTKDGFEEAIDGFGYLDGKEHSALLTLLGRLRTLLVG